MMKPVDSAVLEYVVPLVVSLVSLLACIILVWRLKLLPRACRQRLLVRQLWHLAVADGAFAVVMAIHLAFSLGPATGTWEIPDKDTGANYYCKTEVLLKNATNQASMLLEMHIAMAFLAASFRGVNTMKALFRLLPLCWVIGPLVAVVDVAVMWPEWNSTGMVHECGTRDPNGEDNVQTWFMTVCVIFCALCYVGSSLFVCSSGEVVQQRVWLRMGAYVLVAPLVYGALWYYYWIFPHLKRHESMASQSAMLCVARCFWSSGGLLNFLLYAVQSRYVRVDWRNNHRRTGSPGATALSFRVGFREGESIMEDPPLLNSAPLSDTSRRTVPSLIVTITASTGLGLGEGAPAVFKETGSMADYAGAFDLHTSNDLTNSTTATLNHQSRLRNVTPRSSTMRSSTPSSSTSDNFRSAEEASVNVAPPTPERQQS